MAKHCTTGSATAAWEKKQKRSKFARKLDALMDKTEEGQMCVEQGSEHPGGGKCSTIKEIPAGSCVNPDKANDGEGDFQQLSDHKIGSESYVCMYDCTRW